MKIGVQLYALCGAVAEEGIEAVLSGIKEVGLDGIEAWEDQYGLSPANFNALLGKYGLAALGCHVAFPILSDHTNPLVKDMGFKQMIIPLLPVDRLKTDLKATAVAMEAEIDFYGGRGIAVGYHNHMHEFENGVDYLAELLRAAPSLQFEPDIAYLAAAGKPAADYVKPYENRLMTFHLKELSKDGVDAPSPRFGRGLSRIKQCVKIAETLKLPHVIIEFANLDVPWRDYLKTAAEYIGAC
ncbi:MAG: hypothetical protein LBL66_10330 [Clostridiales bacterium]|jgi:sugar phosphate isomerase/epimerase|nr:hypothetical protein [Clostridiales bacterium]